MALHPNELQSLIVATFGEEDAEDAAIHDMTDNGGYGLVRWSRHRNYIPGWREHIVHRWATTYTDGTPVQTESGLLLYSGAYYDEEEFARNEYRRRDDTPDGLARQAGALDLIQGKGV